MRTLARACPVLVMALGTIGCGDDVPIGSGNDDISSDGGGATGGTGGTGGNGGTSTGGVGNSSGSGGSSASGGSGGTAASGGSGGSAGSNTGGAAGGTGACPTFDSKLLTKIPAPNAHDLVLASPTSLYWSETSTTKDAIYTATLPSGAPTLVADATLYPGIPDAFDAPDSLASDGTYLYWRVDEGTGVWRKPLAGGAPTKVASVTPSFTPGSSQGLNSVLAINATHVFWAHGPIPTTPPAGYEWRLLSAPLAGGTATQIASFENSQSDPNVAYQPLALQPDGANLFFSLVAGGTSGALHRTNLDGSGSTELFATAQYLALSGADVLFTTGQIAWSVAKAGGSVDTLTLGLDETDVFQIHQGIAANQGQVYISSFGTTFSSGLGCCSCGWVISVPETGTLAEPDVVWAGTGRPGAIAVSDQYVVTVDIDNGEILVLTP